MSKGRRPGNTVKGSRWWLRTSGRNRARDWDKTLQEYYAGLYRDLSKEVYRALLERAEESGKT